MGVWDRCPVSRTPLPRSGDAASRGTARHLPGFGWGCPGRPEVGARVSAAFGARSPEVRSWAAAMRAVCGSRVAKATGRRAWIGPPVGPPRLRRAASPTRVVGDCNTRKMATFAEWAANCCAALHNSTHRACAVEPRAVRRLLATRAHGGMHRASTQNALGWCALCTRRRSALRTKAVTGAPRNGGAVGVWRASRCARLTVGTHARSARTQGGTRRSESAATGLDTLVGVGRRFGTDRGCAGSGV
jgi:hypothetical protein